MTDESLDADSYAIAAAMAARWLAAYHAQEPQAANMMQALRADNRGVALAFAAMGDLFVNTLEQLERAKAIDCTVQAWLDQLALSAGAAADEVVSRYRGDS